MGVDEEFDRVRTTLRAEEQALAREFDRIDAEARATIDASVEHVRTELATQADRIREAIAQQRAEVEARAAESAQELEGDGGVADEGAWAEEHDDAAVVAYEARKVPDANAAKFVVEVFRDMRKELAPLKGQERKTWIQAIQVGDTAIVGVPAEFFTVLGQDIKRRSPFRHTFVFELANDYIGYVADRKGYELGGYQTWTGLHSFVPSGTGEMIVDESIKLLQQLHSDSETAPAAR